LVKNLIAGEYRIYANLADGTKPYVDICLAKSRRSKQLTHRGERLPALSSF
jgi:hypothetical protein